MFICRVVGSIVATAKDSGFVGTKLLLVQQVNADGAVQGTPFVATDTVGAGAGETVLVVTGGAARATNTTRNAPTDAAIVGIVDRMDLEKKEEQAHDAAV